MNIQSREWTQGRPPVINSVDDICMFVPGVPSETVYLFRKKRDMTKHCGSSETIRKTSFQFQTFLTHLRLKIDKNTIPRAFLEWFIGFCEGDVSFAFYRDEFTIDHKERRVLLKIRTTLGFGQVAGPYVGEKENIYYRYSATGHENMLRIVHLFNGNLFLDKTNARFRSFLEAYNRKAVELNQPSVAYAGKLPHLSFGETGWLSGFTDADGCFYVGKLKDPRYSLGYRVRCRFILDQLSERPALEKIRDEFIKNGNISIRKTRNRHGKILHRPVGEEMYRYECTHTGVLDPLLMDYFQSFPLQTWKAIAFVRFRKVIHYCKTRKQMPWTGKVLKRVETLLEKLEEKETEGV